MYTAPVILTLLLNSVGETVISLRVTPNGLYLNMQFYCFIQVFICMTASVNLLGDLLKTVCAGRGTIIGWDMAELLSPLVKENQLIKGIFAVVGIMSTLVVYGLLQVSCDFYF